MKKPWNGLLTIFLLTISAYVFAKFQGGFVSWFLFYSFIPISIYSLFVYVFAFKGIEVVREVPVKRLTAGESLTISVTCKRRFPIPIVYLLIKDHVNFRIEEQLISKGNVVYPLFRMSFKVDYEIVEITRGVYRWDEITLQTGDPFGLINKEKSYHQHDELVVYPRFQEIPQWRTMNQKNIGMNVTVHRHSEDVSSVMGVRDYAPGDRLSRIHWKASAKTNTLRTKEFEHQVTNDFMFFLDREQLSYGSEESPLFEKAISLTASLARYALKQHFSAGLVSYGTESTTLPISKDQEQLYRMFEHLARIKADSTFSFVKTVLREVVYLPTGTTVVIISARLTKTLAMMMGELSYRKIKVEFFWMTENHVLSEGDKTNIQLLESVQIAYHIVSGDKFSDALSGGGQNVTASS